jgi:hypothetical protein
LEEDLVPEAVEILFQVETVVLVVAVREHLVTLGIVILLELEHQDKEQTEQTVQMAVVVAVVVLAAQVHLEQHNLEIFLDLQ